MTREMTDRELDLAIMRDVLGFSPCSSKEDGHDTDKCYWVDNDGSIWRHGGLVALWPSKEIEDAWLVVEEMRKRGWEFELCVYSETCVVGPAKHRAEFHKVTPAYICTYSYEHSSPRAICEAALAALESERAK
jgi:hypothetical protein